MQGIVFTYRKRKQCAKPRERHIAQGLKAFIRSWGRVLVFAVLLVSGLAAGCICSGSLSSETLKKLDFLFTTNMPERLSGGAWGAFCAGFASDFLFLLAAFSLGLTLWGAAALPFVAFFKGFGVGISAGYLLSAYGVKGIFFYITVLLPGIVVFSMALIYQLSASLMIFRRVHLTLFKKISDSFGKALGQYLRTSLKYLIITFIAAVIDAALWVCLSGLFF